MPRGVANWLIVRPLSHESQIRPDLSATKLSPIVLLKKPKRGQTFKKICFNSFLLLKVGDFELFHTHKHRIIIFCSPNDIKNFVQNYKRAVFFPRRPNLSAGLAEKFCKELTTLRHRQPVHGATAAQLAHFAWWFPFPAS